ncbi:lytic transglycosylase domain-containing protein [Acetobacteraceae bacterium ESL0709]|nr:lytic transglycosylase domain-containing protein [Acetobacteraceae bacterium ESL0697]MDF7677930.1 lytic transglycosylase domain-containing protein [Acetobacteraceae bacterium ESL0709]
MTFGKHCKSRLLHTLSLTGLGAGYLLFSSSLLAQSSPYSPHLTEWLSLTSQSGAQFPAERYAAFLKKTPDWPLKARIIWRYEKALQQENTTETLRQLCPLFPFTQPATLLHCAPYISDGSRQARFLWRTTLSDAQNEQKFLALYGRTFTSDDQWQRYQILEHKNLKQAASRQIARLSLQQRPLAQARFSQKFGLATADDLFAALSNQPPDSELMRLRLRFLRQQNRLDEGFSLWQQGTLSSDEISSNDALAREILSYARLFLHSDLEDERQKALTLLKPLTQFPKDTIRHEALFLSGYIQLVLYKNPQDAKPYFLELSRNTSINSRAEGFYWAGRCEEILAQNDQALSYFNEAASYPTDFYGQLALAHITHSAFFDFEQRNSLFTTTLREKLSQLPQPDDGSIPRSDLAEAVQELTRQGDIPNATIFITYLYAHTESESALVSLARLSASAGIPKGAILSSRKLAKKGVALYPLGYPMPYDSSALSGLQANLPENFLPALVRQESSGDPNAVSPSPAYGLMQLRLPTAQMVARKRHLGTVTSVSLLDPQTNIILGSFYAADLMTRFNGVLPYVLAAYNAGPTRIKPIESGPATSENDEALLEWIIQFPFKETRSYIMHIIPDMALYANLSQ